MRSFDGATTAALADPNKHAEILIWIDARNRTTGATEGQGFWTGPDDQSFNTGSGSRLYKGCGRVVSVDNFQFREGLDIITHNFTLSMADADVEYLVRGTDCRLAPVEIHRALFDANGNLIGTPHPMRIGHIDEEQVTTADSYTVQMTSVPLTRMGTVTLNEMQSDANQQERSGDRFLRYNSAVNVEEPFGTGALNGGAFDDDNPRKRRR